MSAESSAESMNSWFNSRRRRNRSSLKLPAWIIRAGAAECNEASYVTSVLSIIESAIPGTAAEHAVPVRTELFFSLLASEGSKGDCCGGSRYEKQQSRAAPRIILLRSSRSLQFLRRNLDCDAREWERANEIRRCILFRQCFNVPSAFRTRELAPRISRLCISTLERLFRIWRSTFSNGTREKDHSFFQLWHRSFTTG